MTKYIITALSLAVLMAAGTAANAQKKKYDLCGPKDPTCVCQVIWNGTCPK